jgi:type I restriction enzyme S subunit
MEFAQVAVPIASRPVGAESIRCVELENIGQGNGKLLGWREGKSNEGSKVSFQKNDVLFAKLRPYLRKSWLAEFDGICSSEFWVLRPNPSVCISRFLNQFTLSDLFFRATSVSSGSKMPRADWSVVEESPFNIPPLAEQRRIADVLGTWDEALAKLDVLIDAKDRRKKALLQQLLAGKLRLRGFKVRAWKAFRMGDALERVFRPVEVDQTVSLALVSIRRRLGGLFRRPDVLASEYKTQDLHAVKTGDFLISKRQVVHGAWAIVEPEFDGTLVSKEYAILVNRAPEKLDMRFFAWLAQTPRMLRLARVASTGVHIEKLIFDPAVFLREQIRLPTDIQEQAAIAAVLDTADAELRLLRQLRIALDQQKRGLMQQLLTGRIRVSP